MHLAIRGKGREPPTATNPRLESLRGVLLAARQTAFYRPGLRKASLETPEEVAALRSIEEALLQLPLVELAPFLEEHERFASLQARRGVPALPRFTTSPDGWRRRLGFPVEAIAGSMDALRRLAQAVERGESRVPPATRRVIVWTTLDRALLSEEDREFLWNAFELPIFEQLRGFEAEPLARECEAHAGLHFDPESVIVETRSRASGQELILTSLSARCYPVLRLCTGRTGQMEDSACGCGQAGRHFAFQGRTSAAVHSCRSASGR